MEADRKHPPPGRPVVRERERPRLEVGAHVGEVRAAQDHWRVNLAEPWEVTFWSREFGCSEARLRSAVGQVGDSAGAVRAHLSGNPESRNALTQR